VKPIIGITTYDRNEVVVESRYYDAYFATPALYIDAVRRAGGAPILLPTGETDWREILATIDGLVISGGADIHPARYGGNPEHPSLTHLMPARDRSECALIELVIKRVDLPALCICRGMQVLNVALGGAMHEHIPDVQAEDIHRGADGGWAIQPLTALADSRVARAMQSTTVATYSGHHQAVKDVAPMLQVSASSPDVIVDALYHSDHRWFIGVELHPECSAANDETQQRLFDALVEEARRCRAARHTGATTQ